jgi:glycogen debranching enzyme
MGHLLASRILDGEELELPSIREKLVAALFDPLLLGRHGIRTLATNENRYRPHSYHNGSIWPWDNFAISRGLARHGYQAEARQLWQKIRHITDVTRRFPEFISGEDTPEPHLPELLIKVLDQQYDLLHTIEQPPQELQAWTVAAAVAIERLLKK